MREFITIVESAQGVKITDLYSPEELDDENEAIYHFVDPEDEHAVFSVQTLPPERVRMLRTMQGDMTVADAFEEHADPEQQDIVKAKAANFDASRIIVLKGNRVIDGNHHVMAAILTNHPIHYIDLNQHWDWE